MIMQLCTAVTIFLTLLQASSVPAAATARVAVLPFEIYSDQSSASLKDIIARDLSALLAADHKLEVVDQARVRDAMSDRASLTFSESTLQTVSERLDAPFLVLGSMTRIGSAMSLDTYIFNADATPVFTKEYSQGKNLAALIKEMAVKVSTHIGKMAPPPREAEATALVKSSPVPAEAEYAAQPLQEETIEEATAEADSAEREERKGVAEDKIAIPPESAPLERTPVIASLRREESAAVPPPVPKAKEDVRHTRKEKKDKTDREGPLSSPFASSKPVKITSESLEADNKKNTVTFKGNVVAKQGDMIIIADIMTVDYEKEGGIKTVQASGNVKMSQADRVATGTRIVFYNPEQKIVMTGNPKIWQGDNLISCEKITVLLEEDKIFFEGKVDSTIFPKNIRDAGKQDVGQVEAIPPETGKPASPAGTAPAAPR